MIDEATMPAPPSRRAPELRRLGGVAGAAAAALVAWLIARYATGVHLRSPAFSHAQQPAAVPAWLAIVVAAIAALAGWGVAELLKRRASRPRLAWMVIASVMLLVSLAAPLSGHGVSGGDRLALVCLHLAVAAVLIPAFAATLAPGRRTRPAGLSPSARIRTEGRFR